MVAFAGARAITGTSYTPNYSLPIVMDAVACDSTEQKLTDCTYRNVNNVRFCSHREDARLYCPLRKNPPQTLTKYFNPHSHARLGLKNVNDSFFLCFPAKPGVPRSVRVSSVTGTSITLTWTVPAASEPPSALVTAYSITCSSRGRPSRTARTSATSVTVASVLPYTSYSCCVAADSSAGTGSSACQPAQTNETRTFSPLQTYHVIIFLHVEP